MSAIVRVWWTFFTAFPVQRWLAVGGFCGLGIGLAAALLGADGRLAISLGLGWFAEFALFPAIFASGGILRVLSAPLSHQLLPLFRVRALIAMTSFLVMLAALLGAFLWLRPALPNPALPFEAMAIVFGVITAIVLTMFAASAQWKWIWAEFPLFIAGVFWLNGDGPQRLAAAGISLPGIVGSAAACAWLMFAIWYLRVRRIRPATLLANAGAWPSRRFADGEVPTRALAARTMLRGRLDSRLAQELAWAVVTGLVLCAGIELLSLLARQAARPHPAFMAFIWPFWATTFLAATAYVLVRQSRLLWLFVPGSRAGMLRCVEAAMARRYLWAATVIVTMSAMALIAQWLAPREIGWVAALMLSGALYGCYVGLAAAGSRLLPFVGCLAMAIVQVAILWTSDSTSTSALAAMVVAHVLGACLLRYLATRRWRSIDWLQVRPIRQTRL